MENLSTEDKETMVGAINEVKNAFDGMQLLPLKVESVMDINFLCNEGLYYVQEEVEGETWHYYVMVARMFRENEQQFLQLKLFDTPASLCKDTDQTAKIMFRWGYRRRTVEEPRPGGPPDPIVAEEFRWNDWQTLVMSTEFDQVADLQKWDKRVMKDQEFSGYTKIKNADFPYTTEVGINAFADCTRLETVSLPKATTIKGYAFYNCKALHTANLPEVTEMGQDAFANCHVLQTAQLPKLTAVNKQTFYHCYKLERLELPKVTRIGKNAFRSCTGLYYLILSGNTVCALEDTEVFHETPIAKGWGFIYVPDELVESYKADEKWSVFAERIYPMSEMA